VEWMQQHVDRGVLTVAMHPQVIGRAHRIAMLAQFIEQCLSLGDVAFARMGDVAQHLDVPF
jgi:hypothetical protein